jgi:glycosyltransferase involved in cell wall biosynthesis
MRIAFVSTMSEARWGGSEELWSAAAIAAAGDGHEVRSWLTRHDEARPELDGLRRLGRVVEHATFNPGRQQAKKRSQVRHPGLFRRWGGFISGFRRLLAWRPGLVCFSLGETFDLARQFEYTLLIEQLALRSIPYAVICQLSLPQIDFTGWVPVIRRLFSGAGFVAFVSQRQLEQVRHQLDDAVGNGVVVRNPVKLASTDEVPWPAGPTMRLACVARLNCAHKGQDILLRSLAALPWRGDDWRLSLYGEGPDRARLIDLASSLGLSARVKVAGHATDIHSVWRDNHVMALSSHAEGTSLAMVEAMVCGRPIVITDVGGSREWVAEGESGFLAPSPSVESFSAALDLAWQHRDRWPDLGRRARQTAMRQVDPHPGRTVLGRLLELVPASPLTTAAAR